MVKRKKFIILAVAIILMPFLENLLGLGQIFGAFAQAEATSGETVLSDPNGRLTVVKDSEEEADGNMVWNLTMRKANDENESSKLKVSLTDETAAQGVTLTGDGFQTSGAALVENDFTDDERKMTITAPVGVTVNLSVDYDLRKEIMPAAKMDSESDSEEDGEPASPVTETTENVISANNTDAGAIQLETPADVLEAKAAEEAAQAEAEAKAAEEAAQAEAEAEAKAAEEAAQAEAEAKAAEEAAQAEADAKSVEEATQAEAEGTEEAAQVENDTPATDDSEKDIEKAAENDTADSDEAEVQGPTFRASSMALTSDMILNSAAGQAEESDVKIITNSKSAYLTDWDARTYNLDIHVKTEGDFISGAARVMLVLDTSGSMDYKLNEDKKAVDGEKSRLDVLKTTAASFINQLKGTNSSVAVVKYGREASAVTTDSTNPTTFTSTNQTTATNASFKSVQSEEDAAGLIATINKLSATGATRSDLGLGLAYHSIKAELASNENDTRPVYVIFMSDGVPTTSSSFDTNVARRAEQWSSMIKGKSKSYTLDNYTLTGIQSITQTYTRHSSKGETWYSWDDVGDFANISKPEASLEATLNLVANQRNLVNDYYIYANTYASQERGNQRTVYRFKVTGKKGSVPMDLPESSYPIQSFFEGEGTSDKPYNDLDYVTFTTERPLLQWKSKPEVYAIQQSSSVATNVKTFMTNVATDATHFLNASAEEELKKIFSDIASKIKSTGVKDVLDKRFEIDESKTAKLEALKAAGMSYVENADGTTTISWDKMPDEKTGIMEIIASIPIKAKDKFAGANAVPTNVSELSGVFIDGTRTPFDITNGKTGEKYNVTGLTNPYVNVKLMDLKPVNTSEGPHEPGADAMDEGVITNGWLAQTQLTDGTDYDSELGAYPVVTTTGIEAYQSKARAFTYHETSNATAVQIGQEKNDETDAGAYADGFGQGAASDDKSKMVGNVAEGNLTHEVKVKAVPEITTNKKSAHLVNWDERVYQVDLTARVDFAQNTADPLVLLVLDASGSMINNNMGGKTRLSVMKDVATGLVTDLSEKVPSADVGVIRFSSSDDTEILSQFVPVKENSSTINQAITDITTDSNQLTRADEGFKLAYQMLTAYKNTDRPVYIMYLTDGVPTRSSTDFNFKIASDAQSYRSLIIGQTSNYSNGTSEKVEKGRYDVDNLKESSIETNWWGQKTTYYHGVATSSSVNPPLGISNTTIYSVLQADNYSGNQGKPYMDFMASDPNKSVKASSADDLKDVFADFLQEIVKPSLVDVVDPHFKLTEKSKADLIAAGATVSEYSEVNGTTITWNEIPLNEPVTKSFQIKAVDSYIGENVVPTNVPGESGINVNGSLTQFDIYAGDTKTDLDTPYVNVKLKPFTGAETSETIWLGQDAKDKGEPTSTTAGEIYGDWRNGVNYGGFASDYPTIVFDDELNAADSKGYEEKPEVSKVYSETGTATAKTLTSSDAAKAYADGYAFTHLSNDKGQVRDNFTTGDFKHTVTIETGAISYLKHLEGLVIPSTVKDFSPTFTVTTDSMSTQSTWNYREHTLALSNLGIGTYTINENTPTGIKAASWKLVVGTEETKYPTELTYTLKSVEGEKEVEVTVLDNYWNDFKIRVQKKDDLGQALLGAEFTLTNVTNPASPGTPAPLGTDGNLSTFDFGGLAPGTYELAETKTPKGHTGLADPITIVIGKDGVVKIDGAGEEWVVEEGSNVITLDVTNKVKGVLPSTGGPGRQMFSMIALILMLSVAGISVIYVHRNRKGGA